jgi:hypothetical protein
VLGAGKDLHVQRYLAHKKKITSLGPPQGPGHSPTVGSYDRAFSHERGNPVHMGVAGSCIRHTSACPCIVHCIPHSQSGPESGPDLSHFPSESVKKTRSRCPLPRSTAVEAMGAMALHPICDSSFTCEDYNAQYNTQYNRAHPWNPFPLRRAHPGPSPHDGGVSHHNGPPRVWRTTGVPRT